MVEYHRLELCSRYGPLRNVSLRVAEADASRRLLGGGEAIAETRFSRSDSAKSCLMISPFSHFLLYGGSSTVTLAPTQKFPLAPSLPQLTISSVNQIQPRESTKTPTPIRCSVVLVKWMRCQPVGGSLIMLSCTL